MGCRIASRCFAAWSGIRGLVYGSRQATFLLAVLTLSCSTPERDGRDPSRVAATSSESVQTTSSTTPETLTPPEILYEPLSPPEHLVRASMTIRGLRPSAAELRRVRDRPEELESIVDDYLQSAAFGDVVRDMHNEILKMRADIDSQYPSLGLMEEVPTGVIHHSTTEAPLKLIEQIVLEDRPYTEVFTADYMLTDAVTSVVFGLDFDPDGEPWQRSQWVDGRPQMGLLSSTELWRRHVSNGSNFNRGRANFIADTFLCSDFATRDIVVEGGIDLSDEFAVAHAVSTMPTCIGCHQALDPLASFWWGWRGMMTGRGVRRAHRQGCHLDPEDTGALPTDRLPEDHCYPLRMYTPSTEDDWQDWLLPPPAFYGELHVEQRDLGRLIVEDPRFSPCMARTFYAYLTQTERDDVVGEQALELDAVFRESGFSLRELVRSVVLSDRFAAARALDSDDERSVPGLQVIRPEQLQSVIEQLTGFVWLVRPDGPGCDDTCWGAVDLGESDVYGFRAMSGGIDSMPVKHPTHTVTPTKVLVTARFAYEAAAYVVREDFALPAAERRLLGAIEVEQRDPAAIRAALVELHLTVLGSFVEPTGDEVDELWSLWEATRARGDSTEDAWTVVLAALLQDPRMYFY